MKEFLFWWLGVEAVGLVAFPLTYAFFRWLPDRGFAFTKVVGLLLLGYGLWAGAVVGLFPNSRGSVILLLLLIAGLSTVVVARQREDLVAFLRSGRRYIIFVEVMFFAVLATAVFIRSFAPDIVWGEKPFELAFLNAIDRSPSLPPHDPWLAGDTISYYYFGYVIVAALTKLTALTTNVTFYLALSLMAALASVAAFGLVYNMIAVGRRTEAGTAPGPSLFPRAVVFGLAAAALMLIVSNLAGIFELMARHGIGSKGFYGLVGIEGLTGRYDCSASPANCSAWYPTPFWWWWKATRMGSGFDVQEFPFFSFQFGDLHPHVILMPFLITAFAVAFQVILMARARSAADSSISVRELRYPPLVLAAGFLAGGLLLGDAIVAKIPLSIGIPLALLAVPGVAALAALADGRAEEDDGSESLDALWWLRHPIAFIFLALLLGGIAFIDTWGVAVSLTLVLVAVGIVNWLRSGRHLLLTPLHTIGFALPLMAAAYLFYAPFYLDLVSPVEGLNITQASVTGFPPPRSEVTRPLHFLLFWLPVLWAGLSFIAVYLYMKRRELLRAPLLAPAAVLWALPIAIWTLVVVLRTGFDGLADEIDERAANLITVAMLVTFITAAGLAFFDHLRRPEEEWDPGQLFAFQLAGFAFLMMLGAELFFVDDLFGWRVNTVFRLWHEGWIIMSIVGGFGLYRLTQGWRLPELHGERIPWQRLAVWGVVFGAPYTALVALDPWNVLYAKWWTATLGIIVVGASITAYATAAAIRGVSLSLAWQRVAWIGVTVVILAAALVYPITVTMERTNGFRNPQSLNGLAYLQRSEPDEFEAIQWLKRNVQGTPVILEAVGTDYSDFSRVSASTGLPTVIGWVGHELQWRGYGTYTTGALKETTLTDAPNDVKTIYTTTDVQQAKDLLERYDVDYVYVGRMERQEYGEAGLAKFKEFMIPVLQNESVTIYRMPQHSAAIARGR